MSKLVRPQQKGIGTSIVIEELKERLKDDDYRFGWVSNIAMSYIDCERWFREDNNITGKLTQSDKLKVANLSAERFIELLTK